MNIGSPVPDFYFRWSRSDRPFKNDGAPELVYVLNIDF